MRIDTLYCPCVGGEVGVDHYKSGACRKPPAPLPMLLGIQRERIEDTTHADNKMTATRLVDCPRSIAIADNLSIPAVDLRKHNSAAIGSGVHLFMEKYAPPGFLTEVALHGRLFVGTDVEVEVFGTADVIRPATLLLEDYKMTSVVNQRYRAKEGGHAEWGVQASTYNLLAPPELKVTRAVFWSGALTAKREGVEAWIEIPVRVDMNEEEILAFKPYGGQTTVADNLRERLKFIKGLAMLTAGAATETEVAQVPLTGAQQKPWVCEYCTVNHVCEALVKRYGMPKGASRIA